MKKNKTKIEIKFEFMGKVLTPTIDIKYSSKSDLKSRDYLVKQVKKRLIKDVKKLEKAMLKKNVWDVDTSRYYPKFIATKSLMLDALVFSKEENFKLIKNKKRGSSNYEPEYKINLKR